MRAPVSMCMHARLGLASVLSALDEDILKNVRVLKNKVGLLLYKISVVH